MTWRIESGTAAEMHAVEEYSGSQLGAVRRALKLSRDTVYDVDLYRIDERFGLPASKATMTARDGVAIRRAS